MKRLLLALLVFSSSSVFAEDSDLFMKKYGGIGTGLVTSGVRQVASGEEVKFNLPRYNLFFGAQVNEWVALEAGAHKIPAIYKGGKRFNFNSFNSTILGFYPVAKIEGMHVIGGLGLSHMSLKIKDDRSVYKLTNYEDMLPPSYDEVTKEPKPAPAKAPETPALKFSKVVPHIMAGLQYAITDTLSVRGTAVYEETIKLRHQCYKGRNSLGFNAAVVMSF